MLPPQQTLPSQQQPDHTNTEQQRRRRQWCGGIEGRDRGALFIPIAAQLVIGVGATVITEVVGT
jgi:hypothetical protein